MSASKILDRVEYDTNGGCWLWTGTINPNGYGKTSDPENGHKNIYIHRLSYRTFVGPLVEGLVIDHKCRVISCLNPSHLRQVTPRENTLCGTSPMAQNAAKTECKRGHPLSGNNLLASKTRGERLCRLCKRINNARRYKMRHQPK